MPKAEELPAKMAALARRHAVEIGDVGFHQSVSRLIEGLERSLAAAPPVVPPAAAPQPPQPSVPRAASTRVNPKDGMTYVWIPPGQFMMGCSPGDDECSDREKPPHEVTITKGFWIGQTPVPQEAYERVMGKNPSHFKGPKLPVDSVTWTDAEAYCKAVGGRLATEAEWEYAARGGNAAARYGPLDDIAWYDQNSGGKAREVGQKQANGFGLYDTLGNVWEWVADWYGGYEGGAVTDPHGPAGGEYRVLRGGSWDGYSRLARASVRNWFGPGYRLDGIALRCAGE
jgi:formylglycine-generating enzyme required for sulfatase activity